MLALLPEDALPNHILALFVRYLPANMRDQLAARDILMAEAMAAGS